jgi:small-conductance mechanosensitive channel
VQIKVLTAEGDAKTELLESVTKLKEQQTALADHLKAVIVEYKSKGGDIVDMVFGIGYSDDMAKAQEVLEESLANHDAILKDPAPVVKVHELADSSVNFVVRPWVETDNYWDVYWDITRSVKERFDAAGVSIPFPQQDVHMHQVAST